MTYREWAATPFPDGAHVIELFPLDPVHPLRHGGLRTTIHVADGLLTACRFDVHGSHRGDEQLLEVRDLRQGMALLNRHGWLTAPFAETLFARIAESALGISPSARALALRDLALTLNAAAVEALWQHLEESLDGPPDPMHLRTRERHLNSLELLTGARMHTTYARIGGVASDIEPDLLTALLSDADPRVAAAASSVAAGVGSVTVPLPKVIRLPDGDAYGEIDTPHGVLGIWLVSRGDKVPHRVHLRTAGFAALASLEADAVGMDTSTFLMRLARTRLVIGEVAR